ncbi:hypothetical protein BH11BAC6_BH11BAC6_03030 [soil metagenome]
MMRKFTALFQKGMLNNQRLTPVSQFALLLSFCGLGIILLSLLTGLIATNVLHVKLDQAVEAIFKPENVQVSRLLQVFSSFLMWGVPAIGVAAISGKDPVRQLGFNEVLSGKQFFFIVLMIIAGFALSGALGELTRLVQIPKNAATYFQSLEDNYNKEVMMFATMKNINDYIFSIMMLAIVPALFEEMFFRGCLQQVMVSLTKNATAGILITSIIFSAIHVSYYGFLPRLFLGLLLGYIFYYSKNIWLSVAAHFLNNAFAVTSIYSLSRSGKLTPEAMNEDTYPLYYGLIAAAVIYALFLAFRKESTALIARKIAV